VALHTWKATAVLNDFTKRAGWFVQIFMLVMIFIVRVFVGPLWYHVKTLFLFSIETKKKVGIIKLWHTICFPL
jgi:hypothetical protein